MRRIVHESEKNLINAKEMEYTEKNPSKKEINEFIQTYKIYLVD